MTTDGWTSRAAQGYTCITITAHYIDDNFEIQNHTLQTRQLNSSHTAENLAEVLANEMLLKSGVSRNLNQLPLLQIMLVTLSQE